MRTDEIMRILDSNQRTLMAGMLAELDARPEFYDLEAFKENLISMLKRQFERLIADNKRKLDKATDNDTIMEHVLEDKTLKRNWIDIQKEIRNWNPDGRPTAA